MIERYVVVAGRIRQEFKDLARVVDRVERALTIIQQHTDEQDFYLDSIALNLHDFYAGLERLFEQIATKIDGSLPSGGDWHRELLRQMGTPLAQLRPRVHSSETLKLLDEYLRFRHVVRNIYAFEFDAERLERLGQHLRPAFVQVRQELLMFADFLEELARADEA